MKRICLFSAVIICLTGYQSGSAQSTGDFRPPAVPLVVHDPYFSIWSMSEHLTGDYTRHWTGSIHEMFGMLRIDGQVYRFTRGWPEWNENLWGGEALPPMKQTRLEITPTRTIYTFSSAVVQLQLKFTTPALAYDLDILSRPLTYITWKVSS